MPVDEFNLVNCPPIFCLVAQWNEVCALQNRHKIMATLHAISSIEQLEGREHAPTFFYFDTMNEALAERIDDIVERVLQLDGIAVRLIGVGR